MVRVHRWSCLIILFSNLWWGNGQSQETVPHPTLIQAYEFAINLNLDQALTVINQYEQQEDPLVFLVRDYVDFFTIFINQDYSQIDGLASKKNKRISQLQKLKDRSSPYHR